MAFTDVIRANIKIPVCGDEIVDDSEQCDGQNLNGSTCQSRGYSSGFLLCKPDCSFNSANCVAISSAGGGGGGGAFLPVMTSITLAGRAYPGSIITLLRDAQVAASTISGPDAAFKITLSDLAPGNYIFSIYAEDGKGIRSNLFTFPTSVTSGVQIHLGGVFIAPTLSINRAELKRGETATIFGQAAPKSQISITINSLVEKFAKVEADNLGTYLYNIDTSDLEVGDHTAKAKAVLGGEISAQSKLISFIVSSTTKPLATSTNNAPKLPDGSSCATLAKGDFNCDKKFNLVDFSIWLHWYKKPKPPGYLDLSKNDKLDLSDFSIFIFNWTG